MKFLAVIPARYASTRFPGKPLVDINGQSMIQRVYERVNSHFKYCCVATDDDKIFSAVTAFGGCVVMTSVDHRSGTDRCAEALMKMEQDCEITFDVVVNIQGDEPFVSEEHLSKIESCFDAPDTQIATLVKRFTETEDIFDPNVPKVAISKESNALFFSRSVIPYYRGLDSGQWQNNHIYWKHIGMYAYKSSVLRDITKLPQGELEIVESLEQLRWLENGYTIKVVETVTETQAIDTPEDLLKVLSLLNS